MSYSRTLCLPVVALVASSCASAPPQMPEPEITNIAPVVTPHDVTLEPLGKAQGYDLSAVTAAALARDQIVYADQNGLTLYTSDKDPSGKSFCVEECTKTFAPFLASDQVQDNRANTFGRWSTLVRADGSRQWALNGKALYTYAKDFDPGSVGGDSPADIGAPRLNGAGVMVGGGNRGDFKAGDKKMDPMPEGWTPALLFPFNGVKVPPGFTIKEVPDAAAFAIVDARGHTVYALNGKEEVATEHCASSTCRDWTPLAAPQLARAIGDFSFMKRDDGIRQWAYKDRPLYTYSGDMAPGYANGAGLDDRWVVASVARYYFPEVASIQTTPGQGRVLATADGVTLYRRDGHILQSGGGHSLRRGQPARPAVGRDLGTDPRCLDACEGWRPFLAPKEAGPHGFWNVKTRDDGTKQWAYQGYALWTYEGDTKPGDMNGHDAYTVYLAHDASTTIDIGTPMDGTAALYWSIAVP
jgi:predicted lipoprotein with Yx(FWY)xxD motif